MLDKIVQDAVQKFLHMEVRDVVDEMMYEGENLKLLAEFREKVKEKVQEVVKKQMEEVSGLVLGS